MQKLIYSLFFVLFPLLSWANPSKKAIDPYTTPNDSLDREFIRHFYEGIQLKEENNHLLAKTSFQKCASIYPEDACVNAELSVIYSMQDSADLAIQYMEKSVNALPDNKWFVKRLIGIYASAKQFDKALLLAERLHKNKPYDEEFFEILISLYKQTEQFKLALKLLDGLEKINGISEKTSFEKFRLQMMSNKPDKALIEIERLAKKFPKDYRYRVFIGDIYLDRKQPAKAFEIYNQVLKAEPKNPDVYLSLSEYFKTIGDDKKAMEYIVLAIKNPNLELETKMDILSKHIEKLLNQNEKIERTEDIFKLLVQDYPLEERVFNLYSAFLIYQERKSEAIEILRISCNLEPQNSQSWISLAQIYFEKEENDSALTVLNKGLNFNPENIDLRYLKSILLNITDKSSEALEFNKQTIALLEQQGDLARKSEILAQNAEIYMKLGQKDAAFLAFEESLQLKPDNVMVLNNFAYYLSEENVDLGKAEKMSAQTVNSDPSNSTYLDTYAWIFYKQGKFSLAKFYIERAIDNLEDKNSSSVIYEHYGDILWMSGSDKKAMEMWLKAKENGSTSDELLKKIEEKGWKR